jgi:thiamine-monophosphate kinase
MPNMPIPFGDDVSAVEIQRGKLAILKTDMLIGKTDVPPGMSLKQAARKAVIMNISDLAAKGATPIAMLTSIGVPSNLYRKDIKQIGTGLNSGAREYGAYILGGDTSEATDLIINCAVFGTVEKKHIMLRSGAQPDDIVAVTGLFGKTAAGLKILLQKLSAPSRTRKTLVNSILTPHARLTEGLTLAKTHAVTASTDSSDGLAWSLHEISKASNVGFTIENLPIAKEAKQFAKTQKLNPTELCLYGGEEYELVVTVKPDLWKKISEQVSLIQIGHATKKKTLTLKIAEKNLPIENRGWEHFKTKHSNIMEQEVKLSNG